MVIICHAIRFIFVLIEVCDKKNNPNAYFYITLNILSMKKILPLVLSATAFLVVTCKKEKKFSPDCNGAPKSYASDVSPIINANCAISGCHASGSSNGPGALTNYNEVNAAKSRIRTAVENGTMPKNRSLSDDQKNKIICWIDAGAPNN
jgi:hypothetical protein